jgi:hypothetical protein
MTIPQLNKILRDRMRPKRTFMSNNNNAPFHNAKQTFTSNPLYTKNNVNAARQHLESFGNR